MRTVHYFPRYKQRENVVTNNTLLLFSRLYESSPRQFEEVLAELLSEDESLDLEIGPRIFQQIGGDGSVPDGSIRQKSFQVLIETKIGGNPNPNQLKAHIQRFDKKAYGTQILLLIDKEPLREEIGQRMRKVCLEQDVWFTSATFSEIIEAIRDVIPDYDLEMQDLVDDYQAFIEEEGLMPRTYHTMHAQPVGWSIGINKKYGLYFNPASRSHRHRTYLGLYTRKAIRGIGLIDKVVIVNYYPEENGLEIESQYRGEPITTEELARIQGCIDEVGWNKLTRLRITLVKDGHFEEMYYRKTSKYGMRSASYFNLKEVIGEKKWDSSWDQPESSYLPGIAAALNQEEW